MTAKPVELKGEISSKGYIAAVLNPFRPDSSRGTFVKSQPGLSSQHHCPILVSLVVAKYDALVRFVHAVEAVLGGQGYQALFFTNRLCFQIIV